MSAGRVQTFDNNKVLNPTIIEVTSSDDTDGNLVVMGKDGTLTSIRIVFKGGQISVTGVLPSLGFKHTHAAIDGFCD